MINEFLNNKESENEKAAVSMFDTAAFIKFYNIYSVASLKRLVISVTLALFFLIK
jgi:hypothetical protein